MTPELSATERTRLTSPGMEEAGGRARSSLASVLRWRCPLVFPVKKVCGLLAVRVCSSGDIAGAERRHSGNISISMVFEAMSSAENV